MVILEIKFFQTIKRPKKVLPNLSLDSLVVFNFLIGVCCSCWIDFCVFEISFLAGTGGGLNKPIDEEAVDDAFDWFKSLVVFNFLTSVLTFTLLDDSTFVFDVLFVLDRFELKLFFGCSLLVGVFRLCTRLVWLLLFNNLVLVFEIWPALVFVVLAKSWFVTLDFLISNSSWSISLLTAIKESLLSFILLFSVVCSFTGNKSSFFASSFMYVIINKNKTLKVKNQIS